MQMSGWGYTGSENELALDLQVLDDFPAVGERLCSRSLRLAGPIAARLLCAGDLMGSRAGCQGDSGGPMAISTRDETQIVGIISFRPDQSACERPQRYTVATRVSHFEEWLKDHLGETDRE